MIGGGCALLFTCWLGLAPAAASAQAPAAEVQVVPAPEETLTVQVNLTEGSTGEPTVEVRITGDGGTDVTLTVPLDTSRGFDEIEY
jgi:hypothetical protein